MHTRSFLLPLSLTALAVFSPSQTAASTEAPHILIDSVGPDGWRVRLGPTNLGSLLESEKGRALWQPGVLPLLGMWQQMVGEQAAFAASRDRLLGYGGRIRVGMWLDPEHPGNEPIQVAVVLEGDGRTDLAALAGDLRLLQGRLLPGEWGETEVDGTKLAVYSNGNDAMTAPIVEGNHLLVAISSTERLAATMPSARALAATSTGKPPAPTTPALRIDIDLAAIVDLGLATADENEQRSMKAFGLDSLGASQISVGTAGPRVRFEVAQQFRTKERGLFAAFLPATPGISALRYAVPNGPGSWKVGHFDFRALYFAAEAIAVALDFNTAEQVRTGVKKEMGVDPVDDLVAHMTDEVLLLTSPLAGLDSPNEVTWSFAVRLRDEAAFQKSLFVALPNARPFLQREATVKAGDIELHRYGGMAGYDLWIAVGNGVFVLAGGRDAEEQVTTLLTAAVAMPANATAEGSKPNPFAELERYLPPGTNGLAVGDLDSLAAMPTEWWLMLLSEVLPFPVGDGIDDPDQRQAVRELLRAHKLDVIRTATGFADSTWRWRWFW